MSAIVSSQYWQASLYSIVYKWREQALELQSQNLEDLDVDNRWRIQFIRSEPWEFAHMINAALWQTIIFEYESVGFDPADDSQQVALQDFTHSFVEKVSAYSCDEKKWAYELHLQTLNLGMDNIREKMPIEWQTLDWDHFPRW